MWYGALPIDSGRPLLGPHPMTYTSASDQHQSEAPRDASD